MTLIRFDEISLEFGDVPILAGADFAVEHGERVCLIGRNGAGKTTVLRLVSGDIEPDSGEIQRKADLRVSRLQQTLPAETHLTVRELVAQGLAETRSLVAEYEARSREAKDPRALSELQALQQRIDAVDGWRLDQRIETTLTDLDLPGDRVVGELSGGWRRRVALARALVSEPELLLLDEPTNHLDLATITWLEHRIRGWPGSVLFITHDRAFLDRLATRIVEIDRGRLVSWPGNYRRFLRLKELALEEEDRANKLFDKRLAEEEAWIRQGIKARRTRNEGRVRALEAMREQRAARVPRPGEARIRIGEAEPSGRKVITARNVSHGYGDETLIRDFSLRIRRGDRIGLVGNNGVGKSTLLRILLGEIEPDSGTVKHGTGLEIGYFDQLRGKLDPDKSVAENIGEGREHVTINGRSQHVVGYLKGFLFSPKRALSPVAALSGGERNRVILAKLFTRPTNLLVMDEPTNDLDVETLEVLEDRLMEYPGTLIVVSHDRAFLDNVVTSILAFEEGGRIVEYVGGYSDWARRGHALAERDAPGERAEGEAGRGGAGEKPSAAPTKLSYKDQRELDALPGRIESVEAEIARLQARIAEPGFYGSDWEDTRPVLEELEARTAELDALTGRWLELEAERERLEAGRRDRA